jgi:glutamine amidotransferase
VSVAILKYNAGNVRSVIHALNRLGVEPEWTDDPVRLRAADKVIFPGVGEAGSAMAYLRERRLDVALSGLEKPVLGICLGLQLLCRHTEEADTSCLGIFPHDVVRFPPEKKVPHIGWNQIAELHGPLFNGVADDDFVYFVHAYYADTGPCVAARTEYVRTFASALQKDNFLAVQFHPEKSGPVGEQILRNFLAL